MWILYIIASTDSDSDSGPFALLLLAGFVFYGVMYMRYRNTGARHVHEKETDATTENMQEHDQLVDSKKGLNNSLMEGANNTRVDGSRLGSKKKGLIDNMTAKVSEQVGSYLDKEKTE
jgi:hypothetical protein